MRKSKKIFILLIILLVIFGIIIIFNPNMLNELMEKQPEVRPILDTKIIKATGIRKDKIDDIEIDIEVEYLFVINEDDDVFSCLVRELNLTKEQLNTRYDYLKDGFEPIFLKGLSKEEGILKYSSIMFLSYNYDELIKNLEEQNFVYEKL